MRNDKPEDRDLRKHFTELREEISASPPSFSSLAARRETKRVRPWIPITTGLATAAAAVALTLFMTGEAPLEIDPRLASVVWMGPTDYLLDTPGSSVLGDIPEVGFGLSLPTLPDPDQNTDDTLR